MSRQEATTTFRPAAASALERASMPTTCACCGREKLKRTVKMTDGAVVMWMGVGCAARGLGVSVREINAKEREAQNKERAVADAARRSEFERWQAHLNARCPEHRNNVFAQIQALGGMARAREGYVT